MRSEPMTSAAVNTAVLFNPKAGRSRGREVATRTAGFMREKGWQIVTLTPTPGDPQARRRLIGDLARYADCLVVVGGDGTLRDVGAALQAHAAGTTLGFIPIGNANVLARELGIPRDPPEAARVLSNGRILAVDAALVTPGDRRTPPSFFMAMLEVGFGAAVIHRVDRWRRRWPRAYRIWGDLLYLLAGISTLRGPPPSRFQIRIDAQPPLAACRLGVIANTGTYAKGWSLTPEAFATDGILDIFVRRRADPAAVVQNYRNAWRRRPVLAVDTRYRRGRRVTITGQTPLWLQVDGDPLPPQTRLHIDILPQAVRILVPTASLPVAGRATAA